MDFPSAIGIVGIGATLLGVAMPFVDKRLARRVALPLLGIGAILIFGGLYLASTEAPPLASPQQTSVAGNQGAQIGGTINNNGPVYNGPVTQTSPAKSEPLPQQGGVSLIGVPPGAHARGLHINGPTITGFSSLLKVSPGAKASGIRIENSKITTTGSTFDVEGEIDHAKVSHSDIRAGHVNPDQTPLPKN